MLGHSFGEPDAAMPRRIGRVVALVHRVAASKKHGVRHSCSVEMRSGWPAILARVDVGLHYIAPLVDVVAEDARDVVPALGENLVIPRRSRKATLAGGDGRFPFQFLASIKVSLLFGKIDNDSWRVRAAFVIPPAGRYRGGQSSSHRLLHSGWQLSAATEKDRNRRQGEKPNELDRFHEARKVCSEFKGARRRLSIGLWSHMRTLITQPNSNLRKTFNSFPKQNSDENVQRNGEIRATSFNERRSNRSFTSAGQELANFGRRRSRRHVKSIGTPARSFRSRDFIGQWRAERAGDGRVEGVRCCLERHWPARRERLRGDRSGQTKTTSQRSCPYWI